MSQLRPQVARPLDPQGATEDTSAGRSTAHRSSAATVTSEGRQDTQTPSGHRTEDGQQDRTSKIKQYTQAPLHAGGIMNTIMSSIIPSGGPLGPPPPRDKYQQLRSQVARPWDPQGATEDTSAGGSTAHHPSATTSGRRQDTQTPSGHRTEFGHQDRTSEIEQYTQAPLHAGYGQGFMNTIMSTIIPTEFGHQDRTSEIEQYTQAPLHAGYGQGFMNTIMSTIIPSGSPLGPPPPKDKYQQLKEDYFRVRDELRQARAINDNAYRELKRRTGELRRTNQYIGHLEHENQRFKDSISGLQNELNSVHQQLDDARNLAEVRGKELFNAQVLLSKADTLSISEVGEKVTALNEEIFQAAATFGDSLIHKRHEVSQTYMDAATAKSQEMVGERLTNILIAQSRKPEPEVNPLLVQVVLQIFMVKFCVSKIQSWYSSDSAIGRFLAAIYSDIRSTDEQAVSGRWRALARANTRPTTETWKKELYWKLQSILVVASWTAQSSEHEDSYEQRLPSIFKAVNELHMGIGEKVTSADLDIFVFECDKIYDPATMDDAYSDGRQSSGKRAPETMIVGTTGIGLGKIKVEVSAKDDLQLQTIIPAKIVLMSTLNEALEPIRSTTIKQKQKKPVEIMDGADPEG